LIIRFFAALTLALALPLGGQAKTMQAVYEGTVQGGTDQGGVFGLGPDAALGGLAFTLTSVFDTSVGLRETGFDELGFHDQLTGGAWNGLADPYRFARLTINGVSHAIGTGNTSLTSLARDDRRGLTWFYQDLSGVTSGNPATGSYAGGWVNMLLAAVEIHPDLDTGRTLALLDPAGGSFEVFSHDPATGIKDRAFGYLEVESFRLAAVPLPASGLLLLVSLAGAGMLRRRRVGLGD